MDDYSDSSTTVTREVKSIIISHNFFHKTPRRQCFQIVPRRGINVPGCGINVPGCGTFVPGRGTNVPSRGNARKVPLSVGCWPFLGVGSLFVKKPHVSVCFYMVFA